MKKALICILSFVLAVTFTSGCTKKSELNPYEPVTLSMWHVYGEQADSPMNRLVNEFNKTTGKEKGIIVDVTMMSNAVQIGNKLQKAKVGNPGAPQMPDLFFCHPDNANAIGSEALINWKDYFSDEELKKYVPEFIEEGMLDGKLSIFPVSKSTHLLFIAGEQFGRFSKATGVTYDMLSTWDGFFDVAEKYYEWSGGKPFCAVDYLIRCVELNAMSKGATDIYSENGWYNLQNEKLKASFTEFAQSIAKGHIVVSDMYSNTQVMTGDTLSGLGSSASILYYNDMVTYADNTSEPINLKIMPVPQAKNGKHLITQAGVGLCAYKTTSQKAEAAAVFAKWLTESERNLAFVTETGYMPVNNSSFEHIKTFSFQNEGYESLYATLAEILDNCTAVPEPQFDGYYDKVAVFYDTIRDVQKDLHTEYLQGAEIDILVEEIWQIFTQIQ